MFGRKNRTKTLEAIANAPVGAAVRVSGEQATIIGTCIFDNAGDRWVEHLIGFGSGRRVWLSIENFDTTVATVWETADVHAVTGGPDDHRIDFGGNTYKRSESGMATFVSKGNTGCSETGSIRYTDFSGPNGTRLSLERFGEEGAGRRSVAVAGNCPNCGDGLRVDALGRCSSCGASAAVDHGDWDEWESALGTDVSDELALG